MLKDLKDKSCIYKCANKYIETNKKEWEKYTVSYRLNPVINEHLFYGTLQTISIFKQQNPITKSASTLLWSCLLQNLSCTWGMQERHLERLSISANMPTISLNCTYWSWTQLSTGQLQLGACHFGVGEQLEAKGHFAIVNSCGYSISCKFLLNAKYLLRIKEQMKLSNQFQEFMS